MSNQASILIIDDDIGIRDGLSVLLGKSFITGTAASGKEALEIINNSDYDIYIIDIFLGDMNGFDILKHIKATKPTSICIMLTGFGSDEDILRAKQLGADEFLHKPITFQRLKKVIDDIKDKKKSFIPKKETDDTLLKIIKSSNFEILQEINTIIKHSNELSKIFEFNESDEFSQIRESALNVQTILNFIDTYIALKNKVFNDEKAELSIKSIVTQSVYKIGNEKTLMRVIIDDKRAYLYYNSFQILSDLLISFIRKYNKSLLRIKKDVNGIEIELINADLNIQNHLKNESTDKGFPSLEILLLKEILYFMNARFNFKQEDSYTNLMILIPII